MSRINPYLRFNGACREAMTFYKEVFGGELVMQLVGESPAAGQIPNANPENVLQASLIKGGEAFLFGSDMGPDELIIGNLISLTVQCGSEEEIKTLFLKFSAGGRVKTPLKEQFWGAIYGEITDKFGIRWLLNYDRTQEWEAENSALKTEAALNSNWYKQSR